jgi:hypothetical protein
VLVVGASIPVVDAEASSNQPEAALVPPFTLNLKV